RGQNVVVIGDANSALQYAIALSEICKHVQIMTLFDRYFADPILVKRVQENPKISAEHEWSAIRFEGNKDLTGVTFQNTKTKETQTIPCQGCFIAIGQIPHNDAYASFVDLNRGFIVTDENMATKTPGLFACGDTRVKKVRQVATAIGDGANAAMNCLAYLSSLVAA
ncbi:MAG: NAD(P)/FAD-dependent oxidoreductase, partial [Candidatus Enteromonas sp.]